MTTTDRELTEQFARALFDHEHRHMRPEWRERAWTTGRTLSDRAHFLDRAASVLPIVKAAQAGAWEEAMRHAIVCGNETSDSWGNLYRLDWIARMEHEIEENPYTEQEPAR